MSNNKHDNQSESNDNFDDFSDQPLPRPKRKRRRPKSERGLPPDQELITLAKTYWNTSENSGQKWLKQVYYQNPPMKFLWRW